MIKKNISIEILIVLFIALIKANVFSQSLNDTIQLKEITIHEKYAIDVTGLKTESPDSILLVKTNINSISDALSNATTTHIKNYGPGRISSTTQRGSTSAQTSVMWNGIKINNLALAMINMAEIQATNFEKITVYNGGSALTGASGSLGGTINLDNSPDWNSKLKIIVQQTLGSTGYWGTKIATTIGHSNLQYSIKLSADDSKNIFNYKESENSDYKINYSPKKSRNIYQVLHYKKNESLSFKIINWIQSDFHEFNITQNKETQKSIAARNFAEAEKNSGPVKMSISIAYLFNELKYENIQAKISSKSNEKTLISKGDLKLKINNNTYVYTSASASGSEIFSSNFSSLKQSKKAEWNTGLNTTLINNRFKSLILIKQEVSEFGITPVIPSVGIELKAFDSTDLTLKSSISRNYRQPSMNDLYWNPGGNPNLKPESGIFFEAGAKLVLNPLHKKLRIQADIAFFRNEIKDNIIWTPIAGSTIWSPQNIRHVKSTGAEVNSNFTMKTGRLSYFGGFSCAYTNAINISSGSEEKEYFGKKVIYIPDFATKIFSFIDYKGNSAGLTFQYTGKRYIYSDNSWYMPPYRLLNLHLGKTFRLESNTVDCNFEVVNIFNSFYQAVAGYPMPGRFINISVKFTFDKTKRT